MWCIWASASARCSAATRRSSRRRRPYCWTRRPGPRWARRRCRRRAACGYTGAGTVEFIVPGSDPSSYYFMEMNTRLQVEHPVTELITGMDLVEWQLRLAADEQLPYDQKDITLTGHAIEARICAEDPARGFLPSGGIVLSLREPQSPSGSPLLERSRELGGVRTDSGLSEGAEVGSRYDPMLSKVIAYGPDRATALRRLRAALADTVTLGVPTNAGFLRRLLAHPAVVAGELDTGLVEREAAALVEDDSPDRRCTPQRPRYAVRRWPRSRPRGAGPTRSRCRAAGDWAASTYRSLLAAGPRTRAGARRGRGAGSDRTRCRSPSRAPCTPFTGPGTGWAGTGMPGTSRTTIPSRPPSPRRPGAAAPDRYRSDARDGHRGQGRHR